MTSKKSFLVNIKTNARRRVWLIVLTFLGFFFSMPVLTVLVLSTEKMYMADYRQTDIYLGQIFARSIGLNGGMAVFISMVAIIAAIQGFSYMYQRKKLDMYMSVPVTKGRRFAAIYLNGFLVYFLSYLLNLLLSFFVGQAMGASTSLAVEEAAGALLGNTILYLAVYHVAILAVMLTGNLIVTVMGTFVLLFYDAMLHLLLTGYMETFFGSFYYRNAEKHYKFMISPIVRFIRFLDPVFDSVYDLGRTIHWKQFWMGIWPIVLVALLVFGAAYWCYTKKPAEACGKAMAFPKTKAVIKILITIQVGLGSGVIFYALSGKSMMFFVFGMLAGTLLCHGVIEVIYDFDIRSMKNGWKSLLVAGGCITVFFCIFRFDVFRYDAYVPKADDVEDIAVVFPDYYGYYYDENLNDIGMENYVFENMHITNVSPILELASANMANWDVREEQEDSNPPYRYTIVKYRLKNGKEVYRQFPVDYMTYASILDTIMLDEAYQKGSHTIYNEPVINLGNRLKIYYDCGDGGRAIPDFTVDELVAAYREDMENFAFTDMMEELVRGKIRLECIENGVYVTTSLPVYPSFTNTVALLERNGIYKESYVNVDELEQIVVRNSNSDAYEQYAEQEAYDPTIRSTYQDYTVEAAFSDRAEMEEIVKGVYPDSFTDYWMNDGVLNYDYYVTVTYKAGTKNGSYTSTFFMMADQIPDFVKEQTLYQGNGESSQNFVEERAVPAQYYTN